MRRASGGPEPAWYTVGRLSSAFSCSTWAGSVPRSSSWMQICHEELAQLPQDAGRKPCGLPCGIPWQGRVVNPLFGVGALGAQSLSLGSRSNFKMFGGSSIDFHSEELHQWSCKSKGEVRTVPQGINASWIQRICDLNVNWPFCSLLSSYWAHQTILTLKLSDMFDPL